MSKYYKIGMDFKCPTNDQEESVAFSGNYVVSDNETIDSIIAEVAESEGKSVDDFNISYTRIFNRRIYL